ncbi:hypothetical protein PVK06_020456 [Gossypium arboreum]|uniref:Uncharacterized protein n=1 Tax=Gossypium arboreum TaxID=29729 RepID=A0ABR0PN30_GOSAR|nr:hypothetical protein PVK06_020456 [Gossypium arboreum]
MQETKECSHKEKSSEELQLRYIAEERRFALIGKGKTDLQFPTPNSKQVVNPLFLKQLHSNRNDNFANVLSFEKDLYLIEDKCNSVIDDTFVLVDDKKTLPFGKCDVEEFAGEVITNQQLQGTHFMDSIKGALKLELNSTAHFSSPKWLFM